MRQKIFSAAFMAVTLTCSIPSALAQSAPQQPVSYAQETRQQVQQWVDGLQTAMPYYRFTLKDFQSQGNQSLATIETSIGSPQEDGVSLSGSIFPYLAAETLVTINHGLTLSGPKAGVAQFSIASNISEDSAPELLELYRLQPPSVIQGVVTFSGDLYTTYQSSAPYTQQIGEARFTMPSFQGIFETYNQRELIRGDFTIPTVLINGTGYNSDKVVSINNIQFHMEDKPIRNDLFDLNGRNQITIEKIQFRTEDFTYFTLNNLKYNDEGKIDAARLYQGSFSFSGNGEIIDTDTPIAYNFDILGTISNLQADSYVKLLSTLFNTSLNNHDESATKNIVFDILSHAPQINFSKIAIALNEHQGNFSYSVSLQPISSDERNMLPYLLAMQKIEVNASMDMPVEWISILFDEYQQERINEKLKNAEAQGYITRKGNRILSTLTYSNGNLSINGKILPLGSMF